MATTIYITPVGEVTEEIKSYTSCSVSHSITDRVGSFNISLPFEKTTDISKYVVGSDVEIHQDGNIFKGWIVSPPRKLDGSIITLSISGVDYTAKTQKLIVSESYTDTAISVIVDDLFTKYVPWATRTNIQACDKTTTIKFPDKFLFEAMEELCNISGYNWFIDSNLDVNFFETVNRVNDVVLSEDNLNFLRGTANFNKDSGKLVNRLLVKGGKAISLPFTQSITVSGNTPIPLFYTPRAGDTSIVVTIGGVQKTLGIQNIHKEGIYNFLINASEKLLIPDLTTSGTGTIVYRYEYPIKIILENEDSQGTYGLFEDVLNVDTSDKALAYEIGLRYLDKYSNPVTLGSIQPLSGSGTYNAGDLIKVEIPSLDVDEYLIIKSVSLDSNVNRSEVDIKLTLENTQRDLSTILKQFASRLNKLESTLYGSDNATVEKYKVYNDSITYPKLYEVNTPTITLHHYLMAGMPVAGNFTI